MIRCKVCGKFMRLKKEDRYEAIERPSGLNALTEGTVIFEAFDCPKCGCQNIVNVREERHEGSN